MNERDDLVAFLCTIARPEANIDMIADGDDLVTSGVIDSLAILEIVVYLETNHQLDVTAVDPTKLLSIAGILSLLHR